MLLQFPPAAICFQNSIWPNIALSEFHANAKMFSAHISVLLDVFPAEELSIAEKPHGITPLHGLIQDFDTEFIDDDSGTYWNKLPVIGRSLNADNQASLF